MRGDETAASALYDRVIAEHEPDKWTFYFAGYHQHSARRFQRALPYYEMALRLDPSWSMASASAYRSLWALGRYDACCSTPARGWPGCDHSCPLGERPPAVRPLELRSDVRS